MKTLALSAAVLMMAGMLLQGCETTRGLGEDVQNTGTNIQQGMNKIDPKEAAQDNARWANQTNKADNQTQDMNHTK